jgi:phosphatidylglycerophosphate synthase
MSHLEPGRAVRDSTVALTVSVLFCAGLSGMAGIAAVNGAAVVTGVALVGAASVAVGSRADRWSGPADRVTLGRTVLIGGCATVTVLALSGVVPDRPWWLVALALPAWILDGVDGAVARRTGTSSAAGARLDMEMDAALLLVLSIAAAPPLGWWVLGIGLMRYLFVAASWLRPRLKGDLAFSQFRRVTAAVQGIALTIAMVPMVPIRTGQVVCALALALLVVSFGRDVAALERSRAGMEWVDVE